MNAAIRTALWNANDVAEATGGVSTLPFQATGVSIDSRTLRPGDLFVAIVGPSHDGHDHVADALGRGAAGALVHRRPASVGDDAPLVMVGDTLEALGALALAARNRSAARIVAVTGSVGKTGTKEALRLVLGRQAATVATEGNLNNHWGLPLSLARMPQDTRYGVFEMGMNHAGEVSPLSRLARPDVAVITNVESVHRAHFRSEEEIALAKAEIFDGVPADGIAVLNRDNRHFARLARAAEECRIGWIMTFGNDPGADVHPLSVVLGPDGTDARLSVLGEEIACRIGIAGGHWLMNSMAVLAVVAGLGADVDAAASALAALRPPPGRGSRHRVTLAGGDFTLVDDSYNASPVSTRAALAVLGGIAPDGAGRRIAVLGDMLELGVDSARLHAALAEPVEHAGVDLVFTAGADMAGLAEALPASRRGGHAATAEQLAPLVSAALRAGDVVMVKGSYGSRMRVVVEALKALDIGGGDVPRQVVNGG